MRILLVCLGNICRSPMAEGVLRQRAKERGIAIATDSAGTGDYHVGEAPDPRAQAAMRKQGMEISDLRARQFTAKDFEHFDILLAMDADNLRNMTRLAPDPTLAAKACLMMDFAPEHPLREVPDPYYGGDDGFDGVFAMLDEAINLLLDGIER
ncbi:MAG: low molecular weight phosphotyrosine protein phosphatase [Flavobacteriales bacterium]|nr:low molecular weight phosphotyrosine protein phosphatase [Flavobacteriales bacterium]